MPKLKDLYYSKYARDWYKPKIIHKIWLKLYFKPMIVIKAILAEIETELSIMNDPDFEWFFEQIARLGHADLVVNYLEMEYSLKQELCQHKLKERESA